MKARSPLRPRVFVPFLALALGIGASGCGPLGPLSFFSKLQRSEVLLWGSQKTSDIDGQSMTVFYQRPTPGSRVLRPGEHPRFKGIRSERAIDKLNFLSLMLALFCGTR